MRVHFKRQSGNVGALPTPYTRVLRWLTIVSALFLAHAAEIALSGIRGHGPLRSALFLLTEGIACAAACYGASCRAGPVGKQFWRFITLAWLLWTVAELTVIFAPGPQLRRTSFSNFQHCL
jgi:hypothetical protein